MLSFVAIVVAFVPIIILIGIVILHYKKPDSLWAIVLNEWQTLAAALVGFSALAITLILQSQIDRQEIDHEQAKIDWAVIYGVRDDLKHLDEELDYILSELTPTDDEMSRLGYTKCKELVHGIRSFNHAPSAMTSILALSGAELTPTVVPIVTDAVRVQEYAKNFASIDLLTDCSKNPKEAVTRHLVHLLAVKQKVDYMVRFIDQLEEISLGAPTYSPLETTNPDASWKIKSLLCEEEKEAFCYEP